MFVFAGTPNRGEKSLLNRSLRLRRAWLLAGGCCSSLIAAALPSEAFAQTVDPVTQVPPVTTDTTPTPGDADVPQPEVAPGPNVDEGAIVVTGIRAGLSNSINIKRKEQGIVEAISAEDIGKLPDQSIAESIARLPGVAAQRVNGRAQYISLRGLSPDFTTTLLNGRQQASSGDNRAVEFDQYPSELLASVVIYKTPDANIAGFGLAGTADLRTVRPLEFGKRAIALNLRGEALGQHQLNSDMGTHGWRGSASYIDQLSPEFGVAVGLAYLDSPSQNQHYKGYNYETFPLCCGLEDFVTPASAHDATFLTGQELFAFSRRNKRLAGIAIAEWKPSDSVHSVLDLYYSRFKQTEVMRGAQWFSNLWTYEQTFTDVVTEDRGGTKLAVSGTANGVAPQLRSDYNPRVDHLFSAGLNNEFGVTDQLKFIADLSYSQNRRRDSITESYMGYGCCATAATQNANRVFDSISWDLGNGKGIPTYHEGLNYADASQVSLGDRAPWGGWGHDGATRVEHVKERIYALDGGFRYEPANLGLIKTIDIGVNYTDRQKTKNVDEWDLMLKNGRAQTLVDSQFLIDPTSLGFGGFGDVLSYDIPAVIDRYYDLTPINDPAHFDKSWEIQEGITTAKARAMFETGSLHGNLGVQIVHADQSSSGQRIDTSTSPIVVLPVTQGKKYTDVLPSLNAYVDLGRGHRIRFAAAKVLARPRMDEMRANLTPGFGNPCLGSPPCIPGQEIHPWSASGGNPKLEPWRAKALDVSYEWYGGKATYFALAGFYKKLDTYVYEQSLPYDFSGIPIPLNAGPIPPGVIVSPIGTITQPANGKGGNIYGIEISGAFEFNKISRMLDGFGVLGSMSKTKSNLNPTSDSATKVRIPGLSGTVYNITGYFEKYGFQARASYRYRSKFKAEVLQLFATRGPSEILADKQVDAQLGYTFPETSRFGNLGILLQVNNLTDSPYRTRIGADSNGPRTAGGQTFVETYEKYGRQYLLGVNYRF